VQNPQQLPPGAQNRQQLPPGLAMRTNNVGTITNQASTFTNRGHFTNGFAGNTNQFGNTNLPPTGGTNRVFSTNHFDHRHFDQSSFRDEAITPADQSLLIQIKQTIITEISVGGSGSDHWMPIHCGVHSGRVRLMGLVANQDQLQRLLASVQQMPGVTGVENALSTLPADQALTENDRVILGQIRLVIPLSQPPAPWTPVSFAVRQGAVGIIGIVPTAQESQRIETTVRQVPGVVQTSNTLVVDMSARTVAPAATSLPR
jgi:osmotically-inducible protein OsmY